MSRLTTSIVLGALALATACKDNAAPGAEAPAAAPSAPAPAAAAPAHAPTPDASAPLVIQEADGTTRLAIEKKPDGGYRLLDAAGAKIGKISVEADRVKAKDATGTLRAKVKRKDNGFKLYGGDDKVLLEGKFSGESSLKLKTDDDTKIGKLDGAAGKIRDEKVTATPTAGGIEVRRGGAVVCKVTGNLPAEPAALLALDGLDVYQQAALLVFVREVF